ncbi:MAG TPA: GNAT family protein [Thermoleophilaceae bacterium]
MTLRPWTLDDVPAMTAAVQDPEIPRWTEVPSPYGEDDAREFIGKLQSGEIAELALAIVDAADGALLGSVGLRLPQSSVGEIGYWVAASARGRGVAPRAVRLLSAWAFDEYGYARIQIHTDPANAASQRVAESAGFTREGVLRSYGVVKGERIDIVMFSLLPGVL